MKTFAALAVLALVACKPSPEADSVPARAPVTRAAPGAPVEKIGVKFVRGSFSAGAGIDYVSANANPCSQGDHATLRCPFATPLIHDSMLKETGFTAKETALTDGVTAHRMCALRFGGRLPSPDERASLAGLQGLVSLLVVQGEDASRRFQFRQLPEWVEEGDCANPSTLSAGCHLSVFPREAESDALLWDTVVACDATKVESAAAGTIVEVGDACPSNMTLPADGSAATLPCTLRIPGPTPDASNLFSLECRHPPAGRPHPDAPAVGAPAAFRCSVPAAALGVR